MYLKTTQEEEAWIKFAAGAAANPYGTGPNEAAEVADALIKKFRERA